MLPERGHVVDRDIEVRAIEDKRQEARCERLEVTDVLVERHARLDSRQKREIGSFRRGDEEMGCTRQRGTQLRRRLAVDGGARGEVQEHALKCLIVRRIGKGDGEHLLLNHEVAQREGVGRQESSLAVVARGQQ